MIQILFALLAGVLTVATPCVLPVLPIVLGTSFGEGGRRRPAFIALGFVISFSVVALVFGLFAHVLGLSQATLRTVGEVLLVAFGLLLLAPGIFERLSVVLSPAINKASGVQNKFGGNMGAFLVGLTIGLIWTPCAGPVLGAILTLIATSKNLGSAAILLLFYAIGATVPMMLIAYGSTYITTRVRKLVPYTGTLQKIFGVLLILLAVALYFNYDTILTAKIAAIYPSFTNPKY